MRTQSSPELDAILTEYSALRQEMVQRINNRAQLLVASVTVTAVIIGLALERGSAPLLLVTPLVACLLGAQVLFENIAVFKLGNYIRDNIEMTLGQPPQALLAGSRPNPTEAFATIWWDMFRQ